MAHEKTRAQEVLEGLKDFAQISEHATVAEFARLSDDDASQVDALIVTSSAPELNCIDLLSELIARSNLPVVVFADDDPERLAAAAIRSGISSFVIDGLEVGRVRPVLEIALERFRMIRALQTELEKSQERLAARKTVEQAKGLLMQHRAMTEQQAYKTLRDMAMRQGKPLKIIAENIIAMSDLLP
ncbi:MAG: ANTAR domain-containing protein [Pseudomonadota bacterium]